jgi:hypothetical protein
LSNHDRVTASAEELWSELRHQSDGQFRTTLEALRETRKQAYNRLLAFRFGVGVYPNVGYFKAAPAANAPDGFFVSAPKDVFPSLPPLAFVASEDAGYALAVDQLELASFFELRAGSA